VWNTAGVLGYPHVNKYTGKLEIYTGLWNFTPATKIPRVPMRAGV